MIHLTKNSEETKNLARQLASRLNRGVVLCLSGPLGAGKTTFASGIINYFLPKKRVLSPTFIIVRHYPIIAGNFKNIFHIDLYRLNSTENWKNIGIDEILKTSDSVVIIEWADRLKELLPSKRIDIEFKFVDENTRNINLFQI